MNLNKQRQIARHFDRMYVEGVTPWKDHPHEPKLAEFLPLLKKEKPRAKALDIGCGDGWISIKVAGAGFEVWGIDSSSTAIASAKKESIRQNVQNKTRFQTGDALHLPYGSSFFDAMIDRGLFHHILPENRPLYLENILRVLKKNVYVYLAVFSEKNPEGIGQLFSRELIEDLFGDHFKIIKFAEDPYPTSAPAHLLHFIMKREGRLT